MILLFGFTLCAGHAVMADGADHWEFSGWEGGGCFTNIAFDPNIKDRVYLTSDVAGIWRSDNLGEHWRFITKGLENLNVSAVFVAPTDSNILYAATAGGVFISKNAGEMWSALDNPQKQIQFSRPQSYKPLAVSPLNENIVCAGTAKGKVWCSENSGQQWSNIDPKGKYLTSGKPISAVLFTLDGQNLWIGAENGLFSYDFVKKTVTSYKNGAKNITDMGISWDNKTIFTASNGKISSFVQGELINSPTIAIDNGKIYRFAQKAIENNEKESVRFLLVANNGWNGHILSPVDQEIGFVFVKGRISPDIKADPTWSWANTRGRIASLRANPFDLKVFFMTNWWGVFRSDDGGKTWVEKIRGAPNTVGSDIKMINENLWVATMDNGLLRSKDRGAVYETVFPSDRYEPAKAGHVWRVASLGKTGIIATSSPWNEKVNQVIVSHDDGKTFKIIRKGLPSSRPVKNTMWGQGYPRALAVDPNNPQRVYLGIDGDDGGGLFVSDDAGMSWSRSVRQPGSRRIYNGLAVDPTDSNRIFWGACGKGGGVYVSTDRGQTWRQTLKKMSWVFDLTVTPDGTVITAGDDNGPAIYTSRDAGETWDKISFGKSGTAEALAIDPVNPRRIALSTGQWNAKAQGKIFISEDGAMTWSDITGDLPEGTGAAALAFSPDGKDLYLSRYAGSVYRLTNSDRP